MATKIGANIYIDGVKHNTDPVSLEGQEYDISDVVPEGESFDIQVSYAFDDGTESELSVVQTHALTWTPIDSGVYAWYSAKSEAERRGLVAGFSETADSWENETLDDLHMAKHAVAAAVSPEIVFDNNSWVFRFSGPTRVLQTPSDLFPVGNNNYTIIIRAFERTTYDDSYFLRGGNGSANQSIIFKTTADGRLNTGWYANNLFSDPGDAPIGVWTTYLTKYDTAVGREERINNTMVASDAQTVLNLQHFPNGASDGNNIVGAAVEGHEVDFDISDIIIYRGIPTEADILNIETFLNNQPHFKAREADAETDILVTFGIGGDLHHNNVSNDLTLNRYKLDAEEKLESAVNLWNKNAVDFVVMNGDYVDGDGITNADGISNLAVIENTFSGLTPPKYHTIGNHDLEVLSKAEFLEGVNQNETYYSFDVNGVHFIVLDACFYADDDAAHYDKGNFNYYDTFINPAQRTWLTNDLAATTYKTVVFVHQRLDTPFGFNEKGDPVSVEHEIDNAPAVRSILEASGKVIGVFQGHSHTNQFQEVNEIPYYTLEAMTEDAFPGNAVAVVKIKNDYSIEVKGFNKQVSY